MANKQAIRDKVSIVGVGCCQFGENWDQSPADMIVDAAYEAYADAGIDEPQEQIDAVFTGSIYSNKGPHEAADALKLFNKPVSFATNYCATGTDLIRLGVMSIAAGLYDTVLVVGFSVPRGGRRWGWQCVHSHGGPAARALWQGCKATRVAPLACLQPG